MNKIRARKEKNNTYRGYALYKDENGHWRQKTKGGFLNEEDASWWALQVEVEMRKKVEMGFRVSNIKVSEVYDEYIESLVLKGVKKSTMNSVKANLKIIMDKIGDEYIQKITTTKLQKLLKEMQKETGYSYHGTFERLSAFFNFAKNKKYVDKNPVKQVIIKKSPEKRILFIDKDLYKKILNNTRNEDTKLFITLLYETGLRMTEALALTKDDIVEDELHINKKYSSIDETSLKTENSYREVPIRDELRDKLLNRPEHTLFKRTMRSKTSYQLKKYNTSPHAFRHTRATNLISAGLDLTTVSLIIGDDIKTIIETYLNNNKDIERIEMERIREAIVF